MKKKMTDEELIALLQSLPREKAPENFEFNLMTRIENRNFGNLDADEKNGGLLWIFIPSATIVTAAVAVLMFMFSSVEKNVSELNAPPVIKETKAKTYVVIQKSSAEKKSEIEAVKIVKAPNDVITKQKIRIPVNNSAGIPLDKFVNKSLGNSGTAATLVSSEEKLPFEFREFLPYTSVKRENKAVKKDTVLAKQK